MSAGDWSKGTYQVRVKDREESFERGPPFPNLRPGSFLIQSCLWNLSQSTVCVHTCPSVHTLLLHGESRGSIDIASSTDSCRELSNGQSCIVTNPPRKRMLKHRANTQYSFQGYLPTSLRMCELSTQGTLGDVSREKQGTHQQHNGSLPHEVLARYLKYFTSNIPTLSG